MVRNSEHVRARGFQDRRQARDEQGPGAEARDWFKVYAAVFRQLILSPTSLHPTVSADSLPLNFGRRFSDSINDAFGFGHRQGDRELEAIRGRAAGGGQGAVQGDGQALLRVHTGHGGEGLSIPERAFLHEPALRAADRKSTRLNSSHMPVSRMPSSA